MFSKAHKLAFMAAVAAGGGGAMPAAGYGLWYRADSGILDGSGNPIANGVAVGTATDYGTIGNATQPTVASQPIWRASGGANNLPWLEHDGSNDVMETPALSAGSTLTVHVVYMRSSYTADNSVVWTNSDASSYVHMPLYTNQSFCSWRNTVRNDPGLVLNTWYVLTWVDDGTDCRFYVNGTLTITYTGGSTLTRGLPLFLFNFLPPNNLGVKGGWSEWLGYEFGQDATDRQATVDYLLGKYAL